MADFEAVIDLNTGQAKGQRREKKDNGGGAFAGGLIGSILGNLLSSVKQLFDPLNAIATLLIAALFPLFKPFLILFIKVGLMLFKWLQAMTSAGGGLEGSSLGQLIDGLTGEGDSFVDKLVNALVAVGFIATFIAALIGGAGFVSALIIALVATGAFNLGLWLGEKLADLVIGAFNIGVWLADRFIDLVIGAFDIGIWLGDVIADIIIGAFDIGVWLAKSFKDLIIGAFNIGTWLGDKLADFIIGTINVLDDIWEFIKELFVGTLDLGAKLWNWIKNNLLSKVGFGGGGSSRSVDDAIITPNGDIIRTNPNDFLIATKTPGDFGGGGSKQPIININGGLITDELVREIGRMLQRDTNLGGGF